MEQKEKTKKYFSDEAKKYYDKYYSSETSLVIRNKRILEMVSGNKIDILDIGCGIGMLSNLFEKQGHNVSACDLSGDMVEQAKKLNKNIDYSVQDVESLEYKDESFDYVTVIGVLEYLENDNKALKEIHRVLKPDGYAIIELNNKMWHLKLNDYKQPDENYPMSRRNHNPFTINQEIEKYGFGLDDVCFYHLDYGEEKNNRSWIAPYIATAFLIKIKKIK